MIFYQFDGGRLRRVLFFEQGSVNKVGNFTSGLRMLLETVAKIFFPTLMPHLEFRPNHSSNFSPLFKHRGVGFAFVVVDS